MRNMLSQGSSGTNPKRRWFFKVDDMTDAKEAMKIGYQVMYGLAAMQAILATISYAISDTSLLSLLDPILVLILAWSIHHMTSRVAAGLSGVYFLLVLIQVLHNITAVNAFGQRRGIVGSLILTVLALYGAYKALQGTIKYHQLLGAEEPQTHI
jgi:hypothetical protein